MFRSLLQGTNKWYEGFYVPTILIHTDYSTLELVLDIVFLRWYVRIVLKRYQ